LVAVGYAVATMSDREDPGNPDVSSAQVDFPSLTDEELRDTVHHLSRREREISFQRRFLHGQIELARADLQRRLNEDRPMTLSPAEIEELDQAMSGIVTIQFPPSPDEGS